SIGLERFPNTWGILFIMLVVTIIIKLLVDYYLKTEIGLALRATGNNQKMIRSFSANTDILIIMGIGLSNGLVALLGALLAQHVGFADVGMGIGMIIIGLASVIICVYIFIVNYFVRASLVVIEVVIDVRIIVNC